MLKTPHNCYEGGLLDQVRALPSEWRGVLATQAGCLENLNTFLAHRLQAGATIFPQHVFRALEQINPDEIKVVILGQDPYHGPNQAQGLAFSVPDTAACPPSLRNIFAELHNSIPDTLRSPSHDLTHWAQQGVLLLNTVLTVEQGKPASHARKGWETITDTLIRFAGALPQPKVFMLWGNHAQAKAGCLPDAPNTLILKANHPSPLSARRAPSPFLGCNHFVMANQWLTEQGQPPIRW
ncbi:MAG: uracil-DNA glycosylase [Pusillimonas sp.]|jgi:uracil-DNA glycosylase|nr:uracil-DNA glycosylase [Pusillimonas sp.]MBC41960.1 uracil-DNA glycosylase [Pusillimonas sp.]HCN71540.1 uracil-DNA glycosylase [Pusillimonas sp.]|tara:strand:- start:307220 stop:307933 length:714 start_codon:yes stop_codon:yes gene_type:complete